MQEHGCCWFKTINRLLLKSLACGVGAKAGPTGAAVFGLFSSALGLELAPASTMSLAVRTLGDSAPDKSVGW